MNTDTIVLIINLAIPIIAFLFGRYIIPNHKNAIQSVNLQLDLLFKQAEYFVSWARQFLNCSGSEKMNYVSSKIADFCIENNIKIDKDTIVAICQKAYDSMIAGTNSTIIESIVDTELLNNIDNKEIDDNKE